MLRNQLDPAIAARRALEAGNLPTPRRREPPRVTKSSTRRVVTRQALRLLQHQLKDGPRRSTEVEAVARSLGIGREAMKTGRRLLGVRARIAGNGAPGEPWMLELPSKLPSWLDSRGLRI